MKFLSIFRPAKMVPLDPKRMEAMLRLVEEQTRSGVLLSTGGFYPMATRGACMRSEGGEISVVDGPFTESKEMVGGFAILQASTKEEILAAARRFLAIAGDGELEMREIMEEPPR